MPKLLLVDDDAAIRRVAALSLTHVGGWEVTAVDSGTKAIEVVSTVAPDVILLDVMMPKLTGPQTYEMIRKLPACAHIPIIFMTAKVQKQEVQGYYDLGATGVIIKPFDPMTISEQIEKFIEGSQARLSA